MTTTEQTPKPAQLVPCGYCTHCGYGSYGTGRGSTLCLHKRPAVKR